MNFTHLHVHSSYSLMDGYSSPSILASRAKELGMNALAITDHNHLLGIPDFIKACKDNDIKPILGYEAYYTEDMNVLSLPANERLEYSKQKARELGPAVGFDFEKEYYDLRFPWNKKGNKRCKEKKISDKVLKELLKDYLYDTRQYHLILIAKNQNGWSNLIKIQSESSKGCTFNGRYMCDLNLLKKYSEDIICTTACIGSYFNKKIVAGDYVEAEVKLKAFHDLFKDNFYLELQPLTTPDQYEVNFFLIRYAKQHNIKLIATNDVHYAMKDDYLDHGVLVNMGWGKTINSNNSDTESVYTHDFWLRSYDEMIEKFQEQCDDMFSDDSSKYNLDTDVREHYMDYVKEALENTNHIADQTSPIKIGSPIPLFPQVKIPDGYTNDTYLMYLTIQALYKYKADNPNINFNLYLKRLCKELKIIKKKGFSPYFLTVYNYVNYCKRNKIPVGPGRGSAAGSLCLFLLKITSNVDPIIYDLSFERFLTEDRTSPPDIDLDFSYSRRSEVIKYFQDYFGINFVSSIGNIAVYGVKSGLKDVGRYLEIPFSTMNEITAKFDTWFDSPDLSFKDIDNLKDSELPNDKKIYDEYSALVDTNPKLFEYAKKFEGIAKNVGVHASGVLITPIPINDYLPTRFVDGIAVTLYSGVTLEKLNFIKFDILGLKTLDIIDNTLRLIDKDYCYYDAYRVIHNDDSETFTMIQDKQSDGLFQLESDLFKHTIGDMQPNNIEDISALNAICRPGPLQAGLDKQYNDTKNGKQDLIEPLRNTLDIVKNTYGAIIYQEQVMAISVKVCGFNANQSDSIVRKIIGKKQKEKLAMLRRMMIWGKKNTVGPDGWHDNNSIAWYDPDKEYGDEIAGALANGYSYEEMDKFFEMLLGFAQYCFNKSHAICYAYIGYMTAYLKKHYTLQFMASLLSMQSEKEKIDNYISVCRSMGISVKTPDINKSNSGFTIIGNDIYFGISSISGVGQSAIPNILENKPYTSFKDFYERTDHKQVKKTVIINTILAGCFDSFNSNRYELLQEYIDIKEMDDEKILDIVKHKYDKEACIVHEKALLGTSITYVSTWDSAKDETYIELVGAINNINERTDKKGKLMAFVDLESEGSEINGIIFSSTYSRALPIIDGFTKSTKFIIKGKKQSKSKMIVNEIERV